MRIAHVVTLVTPHGAYGGPVTVAVNQLSALQERGHDVHLVASTSGFDEPPTEISGVRSHLFPSRRIVPRSGFAGLTSPGLLRWLGATARKFDVIQVHAARDLVTLPAAAITAQLGVPYFLQTHGMIDHSERRSAHELDRLLTRRVVRKAAGCFALTPREAQDLQALFGVERRIRRLHNGVPRRPLSDDTRRRELVFVGRMHSRKRPDLFAHAAERLLADFPEWRFSLIGPDEGVGPEVERIISREGSGRITWTGAMTAGRVADHLDGASAFILPSVHEPYPMAALEALSCGLPIVVTDTCGLAESVNRLQCGLVIDDSLADLERAMRTLMADDESLRVMRANAYDAAAEAFSMAHVAEVLENEYELATSRGTDRQKS